MRLKRYEKESTIYFNEAEKEATVSVTYNKRLKKRLDQLMAERPDEIHIDSNGDYIIPKNWIRINPPRKGIPLTDEQKQARVKQLQQGRFNSFSTGTLNNCNDECVDISSYG